MRHDLTLSGPAFRLRPVTDGDAPFILQLRCNAKLNRYIHPTSSSLDDQLAWLAEYYERQGDYYFVVERLGTSAAEGLISVYNIDHQAGCGEWGRWILRPGSLAAVESAWLIYRCAFEQLALEKVFSRTAADNLSVVSFHDSCGIRDRRLLLNHFQLDAKKMHAVEHRVDCKSWPSISSKLEELVRLTAVRLHRG